MILVLRRSLNNSPPLTCDMLAAKPSYCSVLLPAWILACPAVCSAYRTNPRIASGQSREDVTAQDLSRTGCLRGGCWSGRSGRLMSQLPLSPTIAQSTAGSRSTSGYRALLLVLLGLFAGKGHTKDLYPGRYIYIYVYTPRRYVLEEKGTYQALSCCSPEFDGLRDSAAQSTWDIHSLGQPLSCLHCDGFQMCAGTQTLCNRQRKQGISRYDSQNQTENRKLQLLEVPRTGRG